MLASDAMPRLSTCRCLCQRHKFCPERLTCRYATQARRGSFQQCCAGGHAGSGSFRSLELRRETVFAQRGVCCPRTNVNSTCQGYFSSAVTNGAFSAELVGSGWAEDTEPESRPLAVVMAHLGRVQHCSSVEETRSGWR